MEIRFFREVGDDEPHVCQHGLTEAEVREVFENAIEDGPGSGDTRALIGQTGAGRFVRLIYVPDAMPDSVFVITGYPLGPVALRALRRRMRRRS